MTRIAHIINRLEYGGAELQLRELAQRSSLDHVVIELDGVSRDAPLKVLARLKRALAHCEPDVVFAWLDRSQLAVAGVAKAGIPLVANIRGFPRQRGIHRNVAMRFALKRFDVFVANSQASLHATTVRYGLHGKRSTVIPNGVSVPPHSPPGDDWNGAGRQPRFAFIGRDDPAKGLDLLLTAMERVGDVEIVLIGAGVPERVRAILGDRPGMTLLARTADPWSLIGDVDALLVPSRTEGSPNVVLEAFARRVPVVATAVGGTVELLANGRGKLVSPDDSRALADAIRSFPASVALARDCAERAYEYVKQAHDWSRVVRSYDSVVGQLLAQTR